MNRLHVIIPAGGVGSRLWPLSRKDRPKFLLDLRMSGKSLLQETIDRLAPIAASFTIVTGRAHEQAVRAQIPQGLDVTVLVEPQGRDSMPAIGLAAYVIRLLPSRLTMRLLILRFFLTAWNVRWKSLRRATLSPLA